MRHWIIVVFLAMGLSAAFAATLPPATGPVILTVSGAITATNHSEQAEFDLAMLQAMDPVTFETSTIWTDGPQVFTGVPLTRLMAAVGAGDGSLRATAVNDYSIDIPASDIVDGGPIIAYLLNGQPMSLRDKGPLWIVYPFDQNPEYQSETTYSRSIWQLDRLEVVR